MVSIAKKQSREQKLAAGVSLVVFSIFTIVGAIALYPLGIKPASKAIASQHWQQTPCKIISAQVKSHHGENTTYSIDITYEYQFGGATYRSNKYYIISSSSSGYKSKARIVDAYKSAVNPVCFVNPENPSEAVLVRGFRPELLFGFFPLIFLVIGAGGLIVFVKNPSKLTGRPQIFLKQQSADNVLRLSDSSAGPVILKPKVSPKAKLTGSIIAALFWNGIVGLFLVNIKPLWSAFFMLPFIIIGLVLIGLVVYCLLASFNPRPVLIISSDQTPTGSSAHLDWHLTGRTERLKSLTITLRAKEQATYRSGKNQHTETNVFFKKEIYSASAPNINRTDQADFAVPVETMHSFESAHNKIIWEILVRGTIENWPDLRDTYKLTVTPAAQQL